MDPSVLRVVAFPITIATLWLAVTVNTPFAAAWWGCVTGAGIVLMSIKEE